MVDDKVLTYTVPQVADFLHLSLPSVYSLISQKKLPALRFGRKWVIPVVAFNRMLEEAGNFKED